MNYFACDPIIGLPRVPREGLLSTVDDLLADMRRLHINRALVRHSACVEIGPMHGNQTLMREIAGRPGLVPVWMLTPDGNEPDFDPAAAVRRMLAAGAKAAWIIPKKHLFSPLPWCAGDLYAILQEARVPLLLNYDEIAPDDLHAIGAAFPDLRLILLRVPRQGRNRMLYPLLCQHPAFHVSNDPFFTVHEGLPDLCRTFGDQRWLFGSGYPDAEGGAAVTGLMYSGLPRRSVKAVAADNLDRLIKEVRHDF